MLRSLLIVVGTVASATLCLILGSILLVGSVGVGFLVFIPLLLVGRIYHLIAAPGREPVECASGDSFDQGEFDRRYRVVRARMARSIESTASGSLGVEAKSSYGLPHLSYSEFLSDAASGAPFLLILAAVFKGEWVSPSIFVPGQSGALGSLLTAAFLVLISIPVGIALNASSWFLLSRVTLTGEAFLLRRRDLPLFRILIGASLEAHPVVEQGRRLGIDTFERSSISRLFLRIGHQLQCAGYDRSFEKARGLYLMLRSLGLVSVMAVMVALFAIDESTLWERSVLAAQLSFLTAVLLGGSILGMLSYHLRATHLWFDLSDEWGDEGGAGVAAEDSLRGDAAESRRPAAVSSKPKKKPKKPKAGKGKGR